MAMFSGECALLASLGRNGRGRTVDGGWRRSENEREGDRWLVNDAPVPSDREQPEHRNNHSRSPRTMRTGKNKKCEVGVWTCLLECLVYCTISSV